MVTLPFTLLVMWPQQASHQMKRAMFLLSLAGHYALFPLLFHAQELPVKVLCLLVHTVLLYHGLGLTYLSHAGSVYEKLELLYSLGFIPLFVLCEVVLPVWCPQLEFLPLLLTSVYCSVGTAYVYIVITLADAPLLARKQRQGKHE